MARPRRILECGAIAPSECLLPRCDARITLISLPMLLFSSANKSAWLRSKRCSKQKPTCASTNSAECHRRIPEITAQTIDTSSTARRRPQLLISSYHTCRETATTIPANTVDKLCMQNGRHFVSQHISQAKEMTCQEDVMRIQGCLHQPTQDRSSDQMSLFKSP